MKIYAALAKFAKECPAIAKDSENSFFKKPDGTKSRYASLSAIQSAIKAPLEKAGIVLVHSVTVDSVTSTAFCVEDGTSVSSTFPFSVGKPQENGSAVTYAKRYNTAALFNLDTDADDDGNEATKNEAKPKAAEPKPYAQPAAQARWFNHTKFKSTEESDEWKQLARDMAANKLPSVEDYIMEIKKDGTKISKQVEDEIRTLYATIQIPFN
jgi:hypothetical protein